MGLRFRSTLTLAALISISLIFTVYTPSAHYVASSVHEINGRLWWPDTLGGSFYPWPVRPTGLAGQVLVELDQADAQYYRTLIKPGVLVAVTLLLWATVVWSVRMAWKLEANW